MRSEEGPRGGPEDDGGPQGQNWALFFSIINKPNMVNAPEGLNQVNFLPKRFFAKKVENVCQVNFPLNFTRNNSCRACFEMRFLE